MENVKLLLQHVEAIAYSCKHMAAVWEYIKAAQMEGYTVDGCDIVEMGRETVRKTDSALRVLMAECGLAAQQTGAAEIDPGRYHIAEYFSGEVYDAQGNIVDVQAHYCDCYKLHKELSMQCEDLMKEILDRVHIIVDIFNNQAQAWPPALYRSFMENLNPALECLFNLKNALDYLCKWHRHMADQYMDAFE